MPNTKTINKFYFNSNPSVKTKYFYDYFYSGLSYTHIPNSIYIGVLLIETLQIMLLQFTYIDPNILISSPTVFTSKFSSDGNSLSFTKNITKYLTSPLTFLIFFRERGKSYKTYYICTIIHFIIEIFCLLITVFLLFPYIRNKFYLLSKTGFKLIQIKYLLTLHCTTVIELSTCIIIFKGRDNNYINLTDLKQSQYILCLVLNSIIGVIKVINIITYSLYYNDYSLYPMHNDQNNIPWRCPYNIIMLLTNLYKLLLILCIVFVNSVNFEIWVRYILIFLYQTTVVYSRYKCSIYYSYTISKVKINLEGFIISNSLINYLYAVFCIFFDFVRIGNIDIIILLISSGFTSMVYEYFINHFTSKRVSHLVKVLITRDETVSGYEGYIILCKLNYYAVNSGKHYKFIIRLFECFNAHYIKCDNDNCFCREIKELFRSSEFAFKKSAMSDRVIYVNAKRDFLSKSQLTKNHSTMNNKEMQDDDENTKLISTGNSSNTKIMLGKFINIMIYKYFNSNVSTDHNNLFSTLKVGDRSNAYFNLIKIENANLGLELQDNPIKAGTEINIVTKYKSPLLLDYIIYLNSGRIFDFVFNKINQDNHNIHGVEIKNILLYNKLWLDFTTEIKANTHCIYTLWNLLKQRIFNVNAIESQCEKIRGKASNGNKIYFNISNINGHITSSQDLDYKIFKLFGYYKQKIWRNEEESNGLIKKATDEISAKYQLLNNSNAMNTNILKNNTNYYMKDISSMINSYFKLNNTGIVIVNGDYPSKSFCSICYLNDYLWKNIANCTEKQELLGKNISTIMPSFIGDKHDHYVLKYLYTSQIKVTNNIRSFFIIDKDKLLVPVKLIGKFSPNLSGGIKFLGYITKSEFNIGVNLVKNSSIGYIMTDKLNKILYYDKHCRETFQGKNEIIFNTMQFTNQAFYIYFLFPELLNESKLKEGKKHNNILLNYNEYSVIKSTNPYDKFVKTGCKHKNIGNEIPKTYKLGLLDLSLWNFDINYNKENVSFNKAFNIFYIIFEKEESTVGINTLKKQTNSASSNKSENNNHNEDLASISNQSSISSTINTKSGATSVNFILSSIKSSGITNKYPTILKFVSTIILVLLVIIVIVYIIECSYLLSKLTEMKNIIHLVFYFYGEHSILFNIQLEMQMLNEEGFEINTKTLSYTQYERVVDYVERIENHISQSSLIFSQIMKQNNNKGVKTIGNKYLREPFMKFRIYFFEDYYEEIDVTGTNFQTSHIENINNILKLIKDEKSFSVAFGKDKRNAYLKNYQGSIDFDWEHQSLAGQAFISNTLAYRNNFEINFQPFFYGIFEGFILTELGGRNNNIKDFLFFILIGIICFFIGFYFFVFIVMCMLTLKIYAIMFLLIDIPYHYLESCYNDVVEFNMNIERIVEDDDFFIKENINSVKNAILLTTPIIEDGNNNHDNTRVNQTNNNTNPQRKSVTKGETKASTEISNHVDIKMEDTEDVTSKADLIGKNKNKNGSSKHGSVDRNPIGNNDDKTQKEVKTKTDSSSHQKFPNSKSDEKFLKYDPYYKAKQHKHIRNYTICLSLNLNFLLIISLVLLIDLILYKISISQLKACSNSIPLVTIINNLRYILPSYVYRFQINVVDDIPDKDISNSNNLIYNFTQYNNFIFKHRGGGGFHDYMEISDSIFSFDTGKFCNAWVDGNDLTYISDSKYQNKNLQLCMQSTLFNNGIELGGLRGAAIMRTGITEIGQKTYTDDLRIFVLELSEVNQLNTEVLIIYNVCIDTLMEKATGFYSKNIYIFEITCLVKCIFAMIFSVLILLLYLGRIQKKYFEHFMNNKLLILLIPIEYLKMNKKQGTNYI